ncbi:hypothetical protein PUN28_019948 [Cardiocondyla obscurior]|uniref:Transmembrane protein n=1 Tax=Cardiocondyla obscurior TaxID=286306 RepID=A0AAW2ECA0_9HYME
MRRGHGCVTRDCRGLRPLLSASKFGTRRVILVVFVRTGELSLAPARQRARIIERISPAATLRCYVSCQRNAEPPLPRKKILQTFKPIFSTFFFFSPPRRKKKKSTCNNSSSFVSFQLHVFYFILFFFFLLNLINIRCIRESEIDLNFSANNKKSSPLGRPRDSTRRRPDCVCPSFLSKRNKKQKRGCNKKKKEEKKERRTKLTLARVADREKKKKKNEKKKRICTLRLKILFVADSRYRKKI